MVQSGMSVREEALRRRQHAEAAGRIYRQGRRLAQRRFVRSRQGRQSHCRASEPKNDRVENEANGLVDPDGKAGQTYGAKNTPHMFVINPEGKIIYEGAIDSKASANPADISDATNYVKVALEESMAGKTVTTSNTKPYGCSVKYK
jgi:hypothetical protein